MRGKSRDYASAQDTTLFPGWISPVARALSAFILLGCWAVGLLGEEAWIGEGLIAKRMLVALQNRMGGSP